MLDRRNSRQNRQLAERLTEVLADSYLLYNSTQFCHWHVVGSHFRTLHNMFEEQYRELAEAIDMIAERVRILGFYTPGTLQELTDLSELRQQTGLRDESAMLDHLIEGHTTIADRLLKVVEAAKKANDEATQDMAIERLRVHEKTTWMLKSQAGAPFEDLQIEKVVHAGGVGASA